MSTHVLDTAAGEPGVGMRIHLSRREGNEWVDVGEAVTDEDGRATGFGELIGGRHRLGFETGEWGNRFFPFIHVVFEVDETRDHYHIPLLMSPFGYSTYRGS